jgi:hypothetical protein
VMGWRRGLVGLFRKGRPGQRMRLRLRERGVGVGVSSRRGLQVLEVMR